MLNVEPQQNVVSWKMGTVYYFLDGFLLVVIGSSGVTLLDGFLLVLLGPLFYQLAASRSVQNDAKKTLIRNMSN